MLNHDRRRGRLLNIRVGDDGHVRPRWDLVVAVEAAGKEGPKTAAQQKVLGRTGRLGVPENEAVEAGHHKRARRAGKKNVGETGKEESFSQSAQMRKYRQ